MTCHEPTRGTRPPHREDSLDCARPLPILPPVRRCSRGLRAAGKCPPREPDSKVLILAARHKRSPYSASVPLYAGLIPHGLELIVDERLQPQCVTTHVASLNAAPPDRSIGAILFADIPRRSRAPDSCDRNGEPRPTGRARSWETLPQGGTQISPCGRAFLLVYRTLILASTGGHGKRRRHTGLCQWFVIVMCPWFVNADGSVRDEPEHFGLVVAGSNSRTSSWYLAGKCESSRIRSMFATAAAASFRATISASGSSLIADQLEDRGIVLGPPATFSGSPPR